MFPLCTPAMFETIFSLTVWHIACFNNVEHIEYAFIKSFCVMITVTLCCGRKVIWNFLINYPISFVPVLLNLGNIILPPGRQAAQCFALTNRKS